METPTFLVLENETLQKKGWKWADLLPKLLFNQAKLITNFRKKSIQYQWKKKNMWNIKNQSLESQNVM